MLFAEVTMQATRVVAQSGIGLGSAIAVVCSAAAKLTSLSAIAIPIFSPQNFRRLDSRHRTLPQRIAATAAVLLVVVHTASACLWDWDTLQAERRRFPGTLDMITGKFVRHSAAYYTWRLTDRQQRLRSPELDPDIVDDLAVALSKVGRHNEGIELLEKVLAAHPRRYETLANLGTLHMFAGDLATGKRFIDQAIVVNPEAHFGREVYQALLAEYWLTSRRSPHPISENVFSLQDKPDPFGFAEFVLNKRLPDWKKKSHDENQTRSQKTTIKELERALHGVLGMMYFADFESPMLLEALGDLLAAWPHRDDDATQLAARAYLEMHGFVDTPSA